MRLQSRILGQLVRKIILENYFDEQITWNNKEMDIFYIIIDHLLFALKGDNFELLHFNYWEIFNYLNLFNN